MAITQTIVPNSEDVLGGKLRTISVDVTGDAAGYLSGGYLITKRGPLSTITGGMVVSSNAAGARLLAHFNVATKKLIVLYPTGGATAAPAALADPISTTGASTASAVDATTPNITPGRGKEVLNATNLTTCTWRVMLFGY